MKIKIQYGNEYGKVSKDIVDPFVSRDRLCWIENRAGVSGVSSVKFQNLISIEVLELNPKGYDLRIVAEIYSRIRDEEEEKTTEEKKWFNVELDAYNARLFRIFLRGLGVKFETSGAGVLTHFQIELIESSREYCMIESYLAALD